MTDRGEEDRGYHRRDRAAARRDGFQICPHASHRQYVASVIDLLFVLTRSERQNGQGGRGGESC